MRSARAISTVLVFTFVLYWAHRLLQLQHYRHCRADLFRVVLYSQSTMCTHVANVLNLVELVYQQALKLLTAQALGMLGGGGVMSVGQSVLSWLTGG